MTISRTHTKHWHTHQKMRKNIMNIFFSLVATTNSQIDDETRNDDALLYILCATYSALYGKQGFVLLLLLLSFLQNTIEKS